MKKIAVLYLARVAEGLNAFKRFADSYRQYEAGQDHELIVIYKGEFKKGERAGTEHIFRDIPHRSFFISDEVGYDIHAYLTIADQIEHDLICVFNTHTVLLSSKWLRKLFLPFNKPGVGMVGMSASYESIPTSQKIINHVRWIFLNKSIEQNKELEKQFHSIRAALPNESFLKKKNKIAFLYLWVFFLFYKPFMFFKAFGKLKDIHRVFLNHSKKVFNKQKIWPDLLKYDDPVCRANFQKDWDFVCKNTMSFISEFPCFPNPHLRSNGLMLPRKFLLEFKGLEKTKEACCIFESGFDGLTNRTLRKNLSVLLVGADGLAYPIEDWPKSRTFRLDQQQNLIAKDNRADEYKIFSQEEREMISLLSWGEYTGRTPKTLANLGYSLSKKPLVIPYQTQKISVVIPTHNRLNLLKDAIFSVMKQPNPNWELVIFDNGSSDPIKKYINSLNDKRIRFERSEEFLPVTDSWNRAIDYATGEYVILLGCDDGLAPNYFDKIGELIKDFRAPDFIYSGLYYFAHPGVFPGCLEGFLNLVHNAFFFEGKDEPFLLNPDDARKAWNGSINFQRNFTFNMQALTFKRSFLEKIKVSGKIFHSPFPDYYLANVAMAHGERILICPEPLAIQGTSTSSFGYTLFNNLEKDGFKVLNPKSIQDDLFMEYKKHLLPGEAYQANYIITMGHVAKHAPETVDTTYGINRYRRHQILFHLQQQDHINWLWKTDRGQELMRHLKISEKIWTLYITFSYFLNKDKLLKKIVPNVFHMAYSCPEKRLATGEYATLSEIYEMLQSRSNVTILSDPKKKSA